MKNIFRRSGEQPPKLTLKQRIIYALVIVSAVVVSGLLVAGSILDGPDNGRDVEAILSEANVEPIYVIRTDNPSVNCGAALSEVHEGGCFSSSTPDTIYVSTGLEGEYLKYVVLHEYYHYLEFKNGWKTNELSADGWAISKGADPEYASYLKRT